MRQQEPGPAECLKGACDLEATSIGRFDLDPSEKRSVRIVSRKALIAMISLKDSIIILKKVFASP
jgi:hypothetical protein